MAIQARSERFQILHVIGWKSWQRACELGFAMSETEPLSLKNHHFWKKHTRHSTFIHSRIQSYMGPNLIRRRNDIRRRNNSF